MMRANQKPKRIQTIRTQAGVTLLELMVAMAVSSIIMLGISNIYLSTKKSYVIHDEFARIQENGRYTMGTLSTNIRNAGFFGCAGGQSLGTVINGLNNDEDSAWNFQTGLMGYEAVGTDTDNPITVITPESNAGGAVGNWVTAAGLTSDGTAISVNPDAAIANVAVIGSDSLIIRTADGTGARVAKNNSSSQVFIDDLTGDVNGCFSGICSGDILLISDCTKSRIFKAENVTDVGGGVCPAGPCFNLVHNAGPLPGDNSAPSTWNSGETFGTDAEIMKVVTKAYFIGVNPANGITEPSLYLRENDGVPVPLVEGIENMQVLYGVDTTDDGIPNQYFSANDVPDVDGDSDTVFEGVVSVKISLLARTPQNLPGLNRTAADFANLTYAMVSPASPIMIDPVAAANAVATDRRMRKVFNLTIQIRNKSFNISN